MKQLKDGGLAFRANLFHNFKKALKIFLHLLIIFILGLLGLDLAIPDPIPFSLFLEPGIAGVGVYALMSGVIACFLTFMTPSITIYDQYIVWKGEKYFFAEIQGFFLKTIEWPGRGYHFEEEGLYFTMKKSQLPASLYIHFSRLSKQDQKMLIALLADKGLVPLPQDYKPH